MDWDRGIGWDDDLGSVRISALELYNLEEGGTDKEYKLQPPPGKNEDAGYITIRSKEISSEERDSRMRNLFSNLKGKVGPQTPSLGYKSAGVSQKTFYILSCISTTKRDLH